MASYPASPSSAPGAPPGDSCGTTTTASGIPSDGGGTPYISSDLSHRELGLPSGGRGRSRTSTSPSTGTSSATRTSGDPPVAAIHLTPDASPDLRSCHRPRGGPLGARISLRHHVHGHASALPSTTFCGMDGPTLDGTPGPGQQPLRAPVHSGCDDSELGALTGTHSRPRGDRGRGLPDLGLCPLLGHRLSHARPAARTTLTYSKCDHETPQKLPSFFESTL